MSLTLRARASGPQTEFVNCKDQFPAMVAGFGSGKTQAAILRTLKLKFQHPAQDVAYYLPTYDLVRMIGYPRFSETLEAAGIKYLLNKSEHVINIADRGRIIFRTLDNPARIVGYEVADSIVDELDTLKQDDAEHAWRQIIARNRQKKPDGSLNTVAVATTPEGFRFVYNQWAKKPEEGYKLIRASTYSNARNLPDGYIESLKRSYPPQLIASYLEGQFVNLVAGAVYPDFDRSMNHTDEVIEPGEHLHIGLDFNVYNCTATIGVVRNGRPRILGELVKMRDTPHVVEMIKSKYSTHKITIYPDASGQSNKTVNATESDVRILQMAGFMVSVPNANPFVKERVMAVNALVCNSMRERTLLINTALAPTVTEHIEQQVYDENGEPDKKAGKDHACDALGYFIHRLWPIVKPTVSHVIQVPHMSR
ncbi:MAG: terminase [Rhodoferax sp.]|uniref:phage terminase large subunit n=1 Tax=Rhodoferax sp. TaxID=50421 RepID=UPI0017DA4753|nr:phage terminase large subunit [Rhodoferax sp.]NMM21833.1 terminase [Rhodoferax sp.]